VSRSRDIPLPVADHKSILRGFEDAISAIDLDGNVVFWNEGSEQLYGIKAPQILGRSVEETKPGPWGSKIALSVLVFDSSDNAAAVETTRLMRGEKMLTISVRFSTMRDDDGELIGLSALARDITTFREAELARADLSRRLFQAQEIIAQNLVADIHDGVLQELIANAMRLRMLLQSDEAKPLQAQLETLEKSISSAIEELRGIMFRVSPSALEYGGLTEALQEHFERLHRISENTALVFEKLPCPTMSQQNATTLFRIAREAITNSLKHAKAATITISVEESYDGLKLIISDDGLGMEEPIGQRSHFGVQTMRDRAAQEGGHLDVESHRGTGTTITAWIPRNG
jgi:PAS domain S-box-containing protein